MQKERKVKDSFIRNHYALHLDRERLLMFLDSTPADRLQWLEDANDFVIKAVPKSSRKTWFDLKST